MGWFVVDNVTGQRLSKDYPDVAHANHLCRSLNTTSAGGRYGVQSTGAPVATIKRSDDDSCWLVLIRTNESGPVKVGFNERFVYEANDDDV